MSLEPLDLYVEVTRPGGRTFRWDGGYLAENTPTGLTFGSKRNTGFDTLSVTLPRKFDNDYPDLQLFDDIAVRSVSGDSRWEGRIVGINRTTGPDGDQIQVDGVGWMAHMQDQKQPMFYVDQDLSKFAEPSLGRRNAYVSAGYAIQSTSVTSDVATLAPALAQTFQGPWTSPGLPAAVGMVDVGSGQAIGSIYYSWNKGTNTGTGGSWFSGVQLWTDDAGASGDTTTSVLSAASGTGTLTATTSDRRFAEVDFQFGAAGGAATEYAQYWRCLARYGTHGLTKRGTATTSLGQGFYASDVLKHMVANYCPRLNTNGVQDTFLSIPQLNWEDLTTVYDAALQLNGFHIWELNVWEDHTLYWGPLDLTDWDWEVRTDDPGVDLALQGDSADDLVNGAAVHYNELPDGHKTTLFPEDDPSLRDDDPDNPINAHNLGYRPVEISPSFSMTREVAIQIGSIALTEAQQAKRPGTIGVAGGYIRDRHGNLRPSSEVRSGDRIKITNIPGDVIRPAGQVSYDADSLKLTIGVDSSLQRLEAFFDRVQVNLAAQNLASQ